MGPPKGTSDDGGFELGIVTEQWVRVREAARIASVDPRTIRRWADTGRIRARVTPGGHRQVSVDGLGHTYSPADRSRRTSGDVTEVDPSVAVPEWAAAAALWRSWRVPRRLGDDALVELRLDVESLQRSLGGLEGIVTEELRARDRRATGESD